MLCYLSSFYLHKYLGILDNIQEIVIGGVSTHLLFLEVLGKVQYG